MVLDEKKIMKYSALKTTLQYKTKRKVNKYKVDLIMACIMVRVTKVLADHRFEFSGV